MRNTRRIATLTVMVLVSAVAVSMAARAAEPVRHEIELRVNPDERTISVKDTITVSEHRDLTIDIAAWMRIESVHIDGTPLRTDVSGTSLSITLPSLDEHRIAVAARGTVPALDDFAGHRSGAAAVARPDGVYLPGWVKWHPYVAGSDASFRLSVVTPAAYRTAATGALDTEHLGDRENLAVFRSQASPEMPSVFVGPYTVSERQSGEIRLRTYFERPAADLAESYLDAAESYIRLFEHQIGPYPFADFHIVSAPIPVGLGFPNLTYVDRRILPLPFMRGRSLAHEVLHNWWGNGVHVDYATGNWSEGLTTYMADHAVAEQESADAAREMRLGWLRDFAALPASGDIPVNRFVSKRHDAEQVVGYGKVAFIFAMLEHEVGPRQFSAAIQRFWQTHKFGIAGWSDIRAAFEAETDSDLGWFFQQWTERAGAPRLSLEDTRVLRDGDDYVLDIGLTQSSPAYRLKVPVLVTTNAGQLRLDVWTDSERERVQVPLDAEPIGVDIDPDHRIFRRLLPGEAPPILRDITLQTNAKQLALYEDPTLRELADELAVRLLVASSDSETGADPSQTPDGPLLVVGSTEQISRLIASSDLPERPAALSGSASGSAWMARGPGDHAILFVETDDPEVLRGMIRRLPHYRSKSYVIFEGPKVAAHGVWKASAGPLTKRF